MLLNYLKTGLLFSLFVQPALASAEFSHKVISLAEAISQAQQNDPWLQGNQLRQQAINAQSVAAGSLPAPKVSIGLNNLAVDTGNFEQEAMTQLKVGISQMLPRGDSLAIKQAQLQIQARQFPLMRLDRRAKVQTQITQLWLDAYLAQKTIKLINQNKGLFEQMVDIAKSNYSSGMGKTSQQDVIRAQLELIQIDDRLVMQQQKREIALAQLKTWLHQYQTNHDSYQINFAEQNIDFSVSEHLPDIQLTAKTLLNDHPFLANRIAQSISAHPSLQAIEIKYQAETKNIDLAEQQYQPQWGINASYAYRADAPNGLDRADLFSMGLSFDLPLFTSNKQDKELDASLAQAEAIKTEKLLLLRSMMGMIDQEVRQLKRLLERQSIYANQLLDQSHEQAEASLTAYTNDDGDFAEVVRARIVELNTQLSALKIDIDTLKTVARINYYFVAVPVIEDHGFGE